MTLLLCIVAGCGGGGGGGTGGSGGGGNPPPAGTTISATFSNANGAPMPNVIATSSGTFSGWTVATLSGGTLQYTLPPGVTQYAIAYYCQNNETIFEASTSDTVKPSLGCFPNNTATNVTFSYDVHNIAGATQARIDVVNGSNAATSGAQASVTGNYTFAPPFSVPAGNDDIMVKALDNSGDVLGAHIFRAQSISSGNTYPLTPLSSSETTTLQSVGASNAPSGWTLTYLGGIILADGSRFFMPDFSGSYAIPAASQVQPGDYFFAGAQASPANNSSLTAAVVTANAPPASVSLVAPFSYVGPTPADDPAFAFSYSGAFSVNGTIVYQVSMQWGTNSLGVTATKSAVGSNPSIKVPNLAATSSLFPNLPSGGVNVNWTAYVVDETPLDLTGAVLPPNFSTQITGAVGAYTAP
ncbi:MAG TPA: hypothetical protein VKT72_05420 [Candidatus Baltobacteraceae bacterium]|nr:hypothetical protein [Candidatus Baltobacteraceae bacterium]